MTTREPLPEKLPMRAVMYADGARGAAMQALVNDEHGIMMTAIRASRDAPFVETWIAKAFPDREFASLHDLRAAWSGLDIH